MNDPSFRTGAPVLEDPPSNRLVLHHLRQAIIDGTFRPGDRLHQEDLASEFGVSRIPIREALQRLAAEGLVVLRPQRGAVVRELHPAEIQEIHEIRAALEGMLVKIAVDSVGLVDIARMEALLRVMDGMDGESDDMRVWASYNRDFHFTLYNVALRPHFIKLVDEYYRQTTRYIILYVALTATLEASNAQHHLIFDAVRDRDGDRARQVTERHIISAGVDIIDHFRKGG